jgi:hypothetical protein
VIAECTRTFFFKKKWMNLIRFSRFSVGGEETRQDSFRASCVVPGLAQIEQWLARFID